MERGHGKPGKGKQQGSRGVSQRPAKRRWTPGMLAAAASPLPRDFIEVVKQRARHGLILFRSDFKTTFRKKRNLADDDLQDTKEAGGVPGVVAPATAAGAAGAAAGDGSQQPAAKKSDAETDEQKKPQQFVLSPVLSRLVMEIGDDPYYYVHNETVPLSHPSLASFRSWMAAENLDPKRFTSIFVNLYVNEKMGIGYHCDKTANLGEGLVVSYSFAVEPDDAVPAEIPGDADNDNKSRGKANSTERDGVKPVLATMQFRTPAIVDEAHDNDGEGTSSMIKAQNKRYTYEEMPLRDGTVVTFDAFEDVKSGREHRVKPRKNNRPRINITFRNVSG